MALSDCPASIYCCTRRHLLNIFTLRTSKSAVSSACLTESEAKVNLFILLLFNPPVVLESRKDEREEGRREARKGGREE